MKKPIIVTFALCCCLFLYNPVKKIIFAEPSENTITTKQDNTAIKESASTSEQDNISVKENTSISEQDNTTVEENTSTSEQNNITVEENTSTSKQDNTTVEENTLTSEQDNTAIEENTLTQEQAKELLMKYNNKVNYVYQGDENNFEALQTKGLHGYVFLPDVDTDIGYFVDKESCQIYFFHPSGYLELVK